MTVIQIDLKIEISRLEVKIPFELVILLRWKKNKHHVIQQPTASKLEKKSAPECITNFPKLSKTLATAT